MPTFKPGDIVLCRFTDAQTGRYDLPAIIGADHPWPGMVNIQAIYEDGEWVMLNGAWEEADTRLHPNPDEVWADFCKWRLTNAS